MVPQNEDPVLKYKHSKTFPIILIISISEKE